MSTYSGDVAPGGPSDVRDLPHLVIRKAAVSSMHNNVYLLTDKATGRQLLIDAADDAGRITRLVQEGTGRLDLLVTTHQHWDHTRALKDIVEDTGVTTAASEADGSALPVRPERVLAHGDTIELGESTLRVIELRGHTPGGIALAYDDPEGDSHLFTGDSLFPGGVGNTKNPGQSFDQLIDDVEDRIFGEYDDADWVYPGHGGDTTLGAERPNLDEWRARRW
ncbi:MBL fold metallo-hydrolase [Arsenicicoccus sp. oral taxon 190]|uniref:MBL fold metallo-hydrolase n=1 Tax=Arsenicicoccus sp. oral taxon 190 TaxID=1658671 RepID=UPI00067A27D9|nr:MBL fold metallo-hydrolase [Arsenicicoccus sp. oral taxon 190]AKT51763.1 Zn-dependent hydrolase [Arsenicicoccus sp. oral taxon 190]